MSVMDGLASYEILKTGFSIIIMCSILSCAIALLVHMFNLHYVKTPGYITVDPKDPKFNATLTYTINDTNYTRIIEATRDKNGTNPRPAYNSGPCTVYYPSSSPYDYSINYNPMWFAELFTCIACCLVVCSIISLIFYINNRELAGVAGGVGIAQGLIGAFKS